MSEEMKKLFWELKQYLVPYSPNWYSLCETEQYILNLEQENKKLKKTLENNTKVNVADHKYASEMEDKYLELKQENKELTRLVANKLVADYDYDSILKKQLNEERLKYIALEESKSEIENTINEFEKWLEYQVRQCEKMTDPSQFSEHDIEITTNTMCRFQQCLDKLQELKGELNGTKCLDKLQELKGELNGTN